MSGVVGNITDPSGVTPVNLADVENTVGGMRAKYLHVRGYGMEVIQVIMDAYRSASTAEDFVFKAYGCGMSVVELKWFWDVSWCF